jgi:hypothetical protein
VVVEEELAEVGIVPAVAVVGGIIAVHLIVEEEINFIRALPTKAKTSIVTMGVTEIVVITGTEVGVAIIITNRISLDLPTQQLHHPNRHTTAVTILAGLQDGLRHNITAVMGPVVVGLPSLEAAFPVMALHTVLPIVLHINMPDTATMELLVTWAAGIVILVAITVDMGQVTNIGIKGQVEEGSRTMPRLKEEAGVGNYNSPVIYSTIDN